MNRQLARHPAVMSSNRAANKSHLRGRKT